MGKISSIIELNGKKYNAHTGEAMDGVLTASVRQHSGQAGGFARGHTPSKHIHKAKQASRTLMRHAVKKPSTITNRRTVAMDVVSPKHAHAALEVFHSKDASRTARAKNVHKLSLISRFGVVGTSAKSAQPPKVSDVVSPANNTTKPVEVAGQVSRPSYNAGKSDKMLEKALRSANSHTQPTAKKQKLRHKIGRKLGLGKRATRIMSGAFAILALGGFFAYQNIPNLNVRYASAKAGVHASLPGYQPAGFAINSHVQYSPGKITIAYRANADNRSYTISQKNTTWNSDVLKDYLATTSKMSPQTYPDSGRTIYLHDGSQADWVNNGVWYSIAGDSSLNTEQLIKIATSI